ncbi:LytTR family transcriptional regulator DNA-binding domain-containing protein [Lentibacillus sediminis]|uniref:LytTR family transcriptional regulator DNA-binding domain-containing protein n=1 Tax=Lentibacillus sediminis TaxID=1940529 RepID=UPI000C1C4155|nr:response regulator transcription factor [Lentibacillus sediminis]
MTNYKLEMPDSEILPSFSLTIPTSCTTAIYSDSDLQAELANKLEKEIHIPVFDGREELYERLTVEQNINFYRKWFGCTKPVSEILVMFELHRQADVPLRKCGISEVRRVFYAKYYMMAAAPIVYREPIHGVDILTINTFMNMLKKLADANIPVLILASNLEHALLLGDTSYKLQDKGLTAIEMDSGDKGTPKDEGRPSAASLFKITAKVEDKLILFDPPEIDYIESQDGKAMIVINDESFAMDETLSSIEKKLERYGFFRCHRSYIVNLQKVREIITWSKNTYSIRVDNKIQSTIPLSRTKIQEIQEIFSSK